LNSFNEVVDLVKEKFDVYVEQEVASNVMFIKVAGLDNYSLARYILENFKKIKITVKEREGYKFSDSEWIKIEESNNNELVLTK
jgi:hypothetical protein